MVNILHTLYGGRNGGASPKRIAWGDLGLPAAKELGGGGTGVGGEGFEGFVAHCGKGLGRDACVGRFATLSTVRDGGEERAVGFEKEGACG